ncbi:MAG: hypothetical protein KH050_10150 [Clostridiaceae bacterium]|nr:hypothetical protein [Clostridiaceae bacterium]
MKRIFSLVFLCLFLLTGCEKPEQADVAALPLPETEGIAPYKFSAQETALLRTFGVPVETHAQMLSFRAPEEAVTLRVNAYQLSEDKTAWIDREIEDVAIGAAETPHPLAGFLTTQVMADSSIRFHVNCGGISSFRTDALLPAQPRFSVLTAGLHAPAAITPDEEIPILFIAYTTEGKSVRFHTLEDVLDPSDLKDADYAQLITLTFASEP